MKFHLALSRSLDTPVLLEEIAKGMRPRHVLCDLQSSFGMQVHEPSQVSSPISVLDRIKEKVIPGPDCWALARQLAMKLSSNDTVFCPDEMIGIPMLYECAGRKDSPRIVVAVHNAIRPRVRFALRFLGH